jgi:hypothetical protein
MSRSSKRWSMPLRTLSIPATVGYASSARQGVDRAHLSVLHVFLANTTTDFHASVSPAFSVRPAARRYFHPLRWANDSPREQADCWGCDAAEVTRSSSEIIARTAWAGGAHFPEGGLSGRNGLTHDAALLPDGA